MPTTEVTPTGTTAEGTFKCGIFVGTLNAAGAISVGNDVGHSGFLNIDMYIPGDSWGPGASQSKNPDVRRGSASNGETLGVAQWTIPDLVYIENLQAAGTGTAKGLLVEGAVCTLLCRWGLPGATDWAVGQRAYAFAVTLGKRYPMSTDGSNLLAYQQTVACAPNPLEDVVLVA